MTENKEQPQNLEDNLPMVNYIMLHSIYDLCLPYYANKLVGPEDVHPKWLNIITKDSYLGPTPSFVPDTPDTDINFVQDTIDLEQ
jgi:hypothetical protein